MQTGMPLSIPSVVPLGTGCPVHLVKVLPSGGGGLYFLHIAEREAHSPLCWVATPTVDNKGNMLNTSRIIGGGKKPAHREQESLCKGEHPRNRCTHHIAPRTIVTLNDAAGLLPVL